MWSYVIIVGFVCVCAWSSCPGEVWS